MIHEFKLFYCLDEESGNPYLAEATQEGSLSRIEIEDLISGEVSGSGPFPVLIKIDDLRMDMDLDQLYRRHRTCAASKKKMTFKDRSGRSVRFGSPVANSRFPYSMIVTDTTGEESVQMFSSQGHCLSGSTEDDLMEYTIEKK